MTPGRGVGLYVRNGSALLFVSVILQALALARTVQLANAHGATANLDAFYIANAYSVAIFNVAAAAITMVLVPEFVRGVDRRLVRRYVNLLVKASLLASLLVLIGFASFDSLGSVEIETTYTPVTLLAVLLTFQQVRILGAVSTGRLQAQERFAAPRYLAIFPALAPVISLLLTPDLLIMCLALGFGFVAEALGTVVYARRHRPFERQPNGEHPKPDLVRATLPVLASSSLFQVQTALFVTVIAAYGAGQATLYSNAWQIVGSVQALLLMNITLMLYPRISVWVTSGDERLGARVSFLVKITNDILFLLIAMYIVAGEEVLRLLFGRGAFDDSDIDTLFIYGFILLVILPLGVVRDFFYRVLYAARRGNEAAVNSTVVIVLSLVVLAVLGPKFGVWSVFAALAVAGLASAGGSLWRVRALGHQVHVTDTVLTLVTQCLAVSASVAMGRVVAEAANISDWRGLLVQLTAATLVYAVYFAISSMRGWRVASGR